MERLEQQRRQQGPGRGYPLAVYQGEDQEAHLPSYKSLRVVKQEVDHDERDSARGSGQAGQALPTSTVVQEAKLKRCSCPTAGKTRHRPDCSRRKVECPDQRCLEKVRMQELLSHIKEKHPRTQWVGEVQPDAPCRQYWNIRSGENFSSFSATWVLTLWLLDGRVFATVFQKHHGHWYDWVYLLGDREAASRYRYEIRLTDGQSTLGYEGVVHGVDEKKGAVRDGKDCMVLTDDVIKRFMTADGVTHQRKAQGYDYRIPVEYKISKVA